MTSPSDLVASQIQATRQKRDWSAKDLALRCAALGAGHLTPAVIANIETGRRDASGRRRRDVTVDELLAIALALDIAPTDLLQPSQDNDKTGLEITSAVQASWTEFVPWVKGETKGISATLLDGMALCGSCRTRLRVSNAGEPHYFCPNHSCPSPVADCPVAMADERISELTVAVMQQDDFIRFMFADWDPHDPGESPDSRITEMNAEIAKLQDRRTDFIREFANLADNPGLSAKDIKRAIRSFDEKIAQLEREVAEKRRRAVLEHFQGIIRDSWDALPRDARRKVIETLMTVIITPENDVKIEWAGETAESKSRHSS